MAERLHALITENVPELTGKTWYGMPGWATAFALTELTAANEERLLELVRRATG